MIHKHVLSMKMGYLSRRIAVVGSVHTKHAGWWPIHLIVWSCSTTQSRSGSIFWRLGRGCTVRTIFDCFGHMSLTSDFARASLDNLFYVICVMCQSYSLMVTMIHSSDRGLLTKAREPADYESYHWTIIKQKNACATSYQKVRIYPHHSLSLLHSPILSWDPVQKACSSKDKQQNQK